MRIKETEFVKRQTQGSRFSYCVKGWDWVCAHTKQEFMNSGGECQRDGYRNGVVLMSVAPKNFRCGVAKITEDTVFEDRFEARREGEKPFKHRVAVIKEKPQANYVDIVLYHRSVLREDPLCEDLPTGYDWFIVSVNCRETEEEYPIPPLTMARNFLVEAGGTKGEYSAEEFAKSISFWAEHSLCVEEQEFKFIESDGQTGRPNTHIQKCMKCGGFADLDSCKC